MKIPALIAVCLVFLSSIAACDSNAEKGGYPELVTVSDDLATLFANNKMAYSVLIPKGAKVLQKRKLGHTFSYPLKGGLYEYNIHLTPWGANSLEDLAHTATLAGSKEILEKRELGSSDYLVVKKEALATVEVWVNRRGASGGINVKVSGPVKDRAYLLKIAESLTVK